MATIILTVVVLSLVVGGLATRILLVKDGEFKGEHLVGAEHLSLDKINTNLDQLDKDKTYYKVFYSRITLILHLR